MLRAFLDLRWPGYCASLRASTGSEQASTDAASSAALAAPASPIAKVATGTPLGI